MQSNRRFQMKVLTLAWLCFSVATIGLLTSCNKKTTKTVTQATGTTAPTVTPGTPTVGQPQ